ncbi:MAG: Phage tail tube protein [Gaiellaceae bacterium]|jgi:hypothetical protein|nr:Phage tail tube protein [Gaiellaceae bacterium]
MARGNSFGTFIGWGRQTVLGTTVARTIFTSPLKEGLKLTQPFFEGKELRSPTLGRMTRVGARMSGGPATFTMSYTGLEVLLNDLLGTVVTSTLGGGGKQHAFALATDTPSPGLSVEVYRRGAAFLYADCKINKGSFHFKPTEEVTVDIEFIGREETRVSASTPTYATIRPVTCDKITVLTVDGTTVDLDELDVNVDNKMIVVPKLASLGGREPTRNAHREVTGRLMKDFEDAAAAGIYDKFEKGALAALIVTCVGDVISGADSFTFTLAAPKIQFTGETPGTDGPAVRKHTAPFRAIHDTTANAELTAALIGDTATVI